MLYCDTDNTAVGAQSDYSGSGVLGEWSATSQSRGDGAGVSSH